jgi:hypothetical protein
MKTLASSEQWQRSRPPGEEFRIEIVEKYGTFDDEPNRIGVQRLGAEATKPIDGSENGAAIDIPPAGARVRARP